MSLEERKANEKISIAMKKYSQVNDIVNRLTEDPGLRTFFTLYLMADSEEDRKRLNDRLWEDAATLPEAEQAVLRNALTKSLKQLLVMSNQLYDKVLAASQTEKASRA